MAPERPKMHAPSRKHFTKRAGHVGLSVQFNKHYIRVRHVDGDVCEDVEFDNEAFLPYYHQVTKKDKTQEWELRPDTIPVTCLIKASIGNSNEAKKMAKKREIISLGEIGSKYKNWYNAMADAIEALPNSPANVLLEASFHEACQKIGYERASPSPSL